MNRAKKYLFYLTGLIGFCLMLPSYAGASLITIDFNELSDGTVVTTQYSGLGVEFSAHNLIESGTELVTYGGRISQDSYCWEISYIQADFSTPVDYVSVELELFEGGSGDLYLVLYDASGGIASFDLVSVSQGVPATLQAQSDAADVSYAQFFGLHELSGINATYADDFTFGTVAPVPEPSTMLLIGMGLVGLAGLRKRKMLR